jgi:hypothetical protein
VTKWLFIHDYVQIYFSSGAILTINNVYSVSLADLPIEGQTCTATRSDDFELALDFSRGTVIAVDLRQSTCSGNPEVAVLRVPGAPIVVWN